MNWGKVAESFLTNPLVQGVIMAALVLVAAWIIKKTKTTKDDAVFAMIVNAFNLAEKGIPDGSGGTLGKIDAALKVFNEEYQKRKGMEPPQALIDLAKDKWAVLAYQLKAGLPNS